MTLKNNRAPLLWYFKLYASFRSHWWIQTGVTAQKHPIRVKIGDFFVPYDLQIWWMTSKKYRAHLLCYIKLCASFDSHRRIQTGITLQKLSIRVKFGIFCPMWPWNLTDDLEKLLCHIKFCASLHHHKWIQNGVTVRKRRNWVLTSVTVTFDLDLLHGHHCDRDLWSLTLTFCMGITIVNGNNDTIMGTLWKRCDGQKDGQGDWTIHRAAWLQLKNNNIPVPESNISHQSFKSLL